jgi:hypothetical protein
MAIWQWDVWIVPRKELIKNFPVIPKYLELDWFESTEWWSAVNEDMLESFFDSLLPRYDTPWAEHSQSWGNTDEDRLTLMIENGKITDVEIRIDLRKLNMRLLDSLIDFCKNNDFLFFTLDTNKFIEPDLRELLENINSSRKMSFVKDPKVFFEEKNYLDKLNKEARRKYEK